MSLPSECLVNSESIGTSMLAARSYNVLYNTSKRFLSTSACLYGRRSRVPWDKRFPVSPEDVAPDKIGGSEEMLKALPEKIVAPTGIIHKVTKEYIHVPEMVPEFVVPDLTGFELQPYVSYRTKEINQKVLSPQDIFNAVYAPDIEDEFRDGKIQISEGSIKLSDGRSFNLEQFEKHKEEEG